MQITRKWHLVDLAGKSLGRVSVEIARLLTGKHKASYVPNLDSGDFVVAVNSDQLVFTGNKLAQKTYHRHSGAPGGYKQEVAKDLLARDSRKIVERAVAGMVPKNKLHQPRMIRLKVYKSAEHPHGNHFTQGEK